MRTQHVAQVARCAWTSDFASKRPACSISTKRGMSRIGLAPPACPPEWVTPPIANRNAEQRDRAAHEAGRDHVAARRRHLDTPAASGRMPVGSGPCSSFGLTNSAPAASTTRSGPAPLRRPPESRPPTHARLVGPSRQRAHAFDQHGAFDIRIEHVRSAHLHRHLAARPDRIDGDDGGSSADARALHGTEPKRPAPHDGHPLTRFERRQRAGRRGAQGRPR